jgi:hypothetical protein
MCVNSLKDSKSFELRDAWVNHGDDNTHQIVLKVAANNSYGNTVINYWFYSYDKDTKEYDRTQYEMLTKDFIDFWDNNENDIMNNLKLKVDYTHIINELFLHYINTTSLFRDNELSANNLIPPGNAYIGDLDYTIIDNSNVKTVCLLNETYKNVFRILYKGLKQPKKYNSHFTILTENDVLKWNKMVDYIWNKKSEK